MLCFFLFASSSCLCYCWLGLAFYRYCSFVFVAAFLARIAKGETCWQRTLSFLLCKITSFEYMCTDTIFECECGAVLCAKCTIAGGQNYFVPTVDGCRDWLAGHTHTLTGGHLWRTCSTAAQLHTQHAQTHESNTLYIVLISHYCVSELSFSSILLVMAVWMAWLGAFLFFFPFFMKENSAMESTFLI